MPFVAERRLEDMINPEAVPKAGRAMAETGGRRLEEVTQSLTPVYDGPPRRSGRPPGALRESVKAGPVRRHTSGLGRGWSVTVGTPDPVGPHVEWTTRPHDIPNAFGFGDDFGIGGRFGGRFHPGTQGHHMFARAAALVDAESAGMFEVELAQFARDLVEFRGFRVIDRRVSA